jgi:hypothetical protein
VRAQRSRRSSVRTPPAVGRVAATITEDLNAAGWTLDVLVAGQVAVRIPFYKWAVPVNRGLNWRFGCCRPGGFNTGRV